MNKKLLFGVQALCSAAILYFLLRNVSLNQFAATFKAVSLPWYGLFLVSTLAAIPIYVFRWLQINKLFGIVIDYGSLLQTYTVSLFFTSLLPGSLGGDGYRAYILNSRTKSVSKSIANILIERGSALYVMILVGTLVAFLKRASLPSRSVILLSVLSGGLTIGLISSLALSRSETALRLADRVRLGNLFRALDDARRSALSNRGIILKILALTLIYQTLANTIVIFLIWSLGFEAKVSEVYVLSTLVFTLINIPISINGIGLREALFVYFFGMLGLNKEATLTISLLVFITGIIVSLLGGVVYASKKARHFRAPTKANDR